MEGYCRNVSGQQIRQNAEKIPNGRVLPKWFVSQRRQNAEKIPNGRVMPKCFVISKVKKTQRTDRNNFQFAPLV